MAHVIAGCEEVGKRQLLQKSRRTRKGALQPADVIHLVSRNEPPDSIARRRGFGERPAGQDTRLTAKELGGNRTLTVKPQVTVYVILDQSDIVFLEQPD